MALLLPRLEHPPSLSSRPAVSLAPGFRSHCNLPTWRLACLLLHHRRSPPRPLTLLLSSAGPSTSTPSPESATAQSGDADNADDCDEDEDDEAAAFLVTRLTPHTSRTPSPPPLTHHRAPQQPASVLDTVHPPRAASPLQRTSQVRARKRSRAERAAPRHLWSRSHSRLHRDARDWPQGSPCASSRDATPIARHRRCRRPSIHTTHRL